MMKRLGGLWSVCLVLAACGSGGGVATSTQSLTNTAPNPSNVLLKGSNATATITDPDPGSVFSMSARQVAFLDNRFAIAPFDPSTLKAEYLANGEVSLTIDGTTYRLAQDPAQDYFVWQNGNQEMRLTLNAQSSFAAFFVAEERQSGSLFSRGARYSGAIGYATDPNDLPAQARYAGQVAFHATPEVGAADSGQGAVTMAADFSAGQIQGRIDIQDAKGDTTGPIDIGNFSAAFDNPLRSGPIVPSTSGSAPSTFTPAGIIDGNTFTARLQISPFDLVDMGVFNDPSLELNGTFFGPDADQALGVAVGSSRTANGTGTQNVLLEMTVSADKN